MSGGAGGHSIPDNRIRRRHRGAVEHENAHHDAARAVTYTPGPR